MPLSSTMYCLKQQVGEGNRHATVAGAPAGRAPCTLSDAEPDIAELKARISAAIDFVQGLPRAEIDAAADKEVAFMQSAKSERMPSGDPGDSQDHIGRYATLVSLRNELASALRPVISLFNCSNRRRASLSR